MTSNPIAFIALCLCALLSGCIGFGPRSLKSDQVDYARALGDAKKREILSVIVGLRYADAPAFLNVSQIIAAYTFDATGVGLLNVGPIPGGPRAQVTDTVSYSNHPTFTFIPTTGESYAKSYIQPLPPALILPLADSGIPVDLLLRIAVQSIGGLDNATMLGGPSANGSPGFFELLQILRRLQLAGELNVQLKPDAHAERVTLSIGSASGREPSSHADDVKRARRLLNVSDQINTYEVVSGNITPDAGRIPMVTRSIRAILGDLGAEIAVPDADTKNGTTKPAIGLVGTETRPIVIVHVGNKVPATAYASIRYRSSQFWIEDSDFDSKYAFTVVQDLMALAEVTDTAHAPIVTIPAN